MTFDYARRPCHNFVRVLRGVELVIVIYCYDGAFYDYAVTLWYSGGCNIAAS